MIFTVILLFLSHLLIISLRNTSLIIKISKYIPLNPRHSQDTLRCFS